MSPVTLREQVFGALATPIAPKMMAAAKAPPKSDTRSLMLYSVVPGVIGAVLGCVLWKKHRVLGFIGGGTVAGSAYPLVKGVERARVGCELLTVGAGVALSLKWKKHPALGYVGGSLIGVAASVPILMATGGHK